jgi:predicted SAM-dependent methyltransferase
MPSRVPVLPSGFDPSTYPRKLNLGCGSDYREGFVNIDMNAWYRPDVLADVTKLEFLPPQYYEELIAQDVLEHIRRTATLSALVQWNRPLQVGGTLWLRVPSLLGIAEMLKRNEYREPARQEHLIQCLFGTQAYTGDFHFTSFTDVLLEHYLDVSGFALVKIELRDGWLFDVTGKKTVHVEKSPEPDFGDLRQIVDDEAFVDACYRTILHRAPDSEGWVYWASALRDGNMPREVVIDAMLGSAEYQALRGRR